MSEISPILKWYVIANILLISVWCVLIISHIILRKYQFGPTHKSNLRTTRYLFLFILVLPVVGFFETPQDPFELVIPINDGIFVLKDNLIQTAFKGSELLLDVNNIGNRVLTYGESITFYFPFVFLTLIAGRLLLLSRSFRKLSRLIRDGYQWKKIGKIHIVISERICIPFSTLALGRFHIVIPTSLLTNPEDLKLAIKHEGTHHRHWDTVWLLFLEVMKLLFCINPFVFFWGKTFEALQENACDEALLNQNDVSLDHYCNCLIRFNQSIADLNSNLIAVSSILKRPVIGLFPNNRLIWRIKMMSLPKKNRFSGLKSVILIIPIVMMAFSFAYIVNGSLFAENKKKPVSVISSEQTLGGKMETAAAKKVQKQVLPSIFPVEGYLASLFGNRKNPFTGKVSHHNGIDISNREGTPIISPADGIVDNVRMEEDMGLFLVIDHGYNTVTRYGHLERTYVYAGTIVKRGDLIARVGNSGRSSGPHLHYELLVNDQYVNPMKYLKKENLLVNDQNVDPLKYLKK